MQSPLFPTEWSAACNFARAPYDVASEIAAMAELMRAAAVQLSAPLRQYVCEQCCVSMWAESLPDACVACQASAEFSIYQIGQFDETGYGMYQCSQCSMTWASQDIVCRSDPQLPRCPRLKPFQCHSRSTVLVKIGPAEIKHAYLEYHFARRRICRLAPRPAVQSPPPAIPAPTLSITPPADADAKPEQRMCPRCKFIGMYNNPRAHRCRKCGMRVFVVKTF